MKNRRANAKNSGNILRDFRDTLESEKSPPSIVPTRSNKQTNKPTTMRNANKTGIAKRISWTDNQRVINAEISKQKKTKNQNKFKKTIQILIWNTEEGEDGMWQMESVGCESLSQGMLQRMSEATRATGDDAMWLRLQPQENPSGDAIKLCVGNAAATNKSLLLW